MSLGRSCVHNFKVDDYTKKDTSFYKSFIMVARRHLPTTLLKDPPANDYCNEVWVITIKTIMPGVDNTPDKIERDWTHIHIYEAVGSHGYC